MLIAASLGLAALQAEATNLADAATHINSWPWPYILACSGHRLPAMRASSVRGNLRAKSSDKISSFSSLSLLFERPSDGMAAASTNWPLEIRSISAQPQNSSSAWRSFVGPTKPLRTFSSAPDTNESSPMLAMQLMSWPWVWGRHFSAQMSSCWSVLWAEWRRVVWSKLQLRR